jgi:hypothetical protein
MEKGSVAALSVPIQVKGVNWHLAAGRTQDDSAATVPENKNQSGPYFTAFSLDIPDMRVEIVKTGARSPRF